MIVAIVNRDLQIPDDEAVLTDERIDAAMKDVLAALTETLGVRLRG